MKNLIKEVFSLWKLMLTIGIVMAFMQYFHLLFMSGVNPIISNAVMLILLFGLIVYVIIGKPFKNKASVLAIIVAIVLAIGLGIAIGRMVLGWEFTVSSSDYVPRRYYN